MGKNSEGVGEIKEINSRTILDTILTEELGQIGKFQLLNVALGFVVVITIGCSSSDYVFTAARITTRCLIPECDSASPEFSPPWLVNAVPAAGDSFDNCQRFANNTNIADFAIADTCPAELFDTSTIVNCDQYVYSTQDTIVYDFDLGCNDWLRSLVGSFRKLGNLFALPITGYISDRWGRRTALVFNAINTAWLGTIRYWTNSYITFIISVIIESTFGGALFSCIYIMILEMVGPKHRVILSVSIKSGRAVGEILLATLAWALPTWRELTLAIYVPQLLSIAYFWLFTESVLWYMCNGRFKKAEKVLHKIARINGKKLCQTSLDALRKTVEQEMRDKDVQEKLEASEPWLIVEVFRHKNVLITCLVAPVWWITATMVYYGMTINSVGLAGNRYLNFSAVVSVQVPGMWIAAFLLDRLGRKPVLMASFWLCSVCQFAYVFIPDDMFALSLAVYLVGNCSISAVMTAVYVYTLELYPTKYRHRLFGFSSMVGRIGAIIAPLTPAFAAAVWDKLPFAMFGSLSLVSGVLLFLTPETLGSTLPNTMEEAERLGNKRKA